MQTEMKVVAAALFVFAVQPAPAMHPPSKQTGAAKGPLFLTSKPNNI